MPLENNQFKPQRNPLNLDFGNQKPQGEPSPLEMDESDLEPIELIEEETAEATEPSKITTFETNSVLVQRDKRRYKRSLSQGAGATRIRVFHAKLGDQAMSHMEELINEWIDESPDIEIKFTSTTVGVVEGKRSEPHLIVTVWY
jgi:hypothetical protein